jgi:transcriptional regulator with XRE-family HTH domain
MRGTAFADQEGLGMALTGGSFAERLRSVRERQGVSQYALAKRTGLSKQALSQLEQGGSDPAWTTVQLLALALDVDCAAFADPALKLPESEPARPRGRPRKTEAEQASPAPPQRAGRKRKK